MMSMVYRAILAIFFGFLHVFQYYKGNLILKCEKLLIKTEYHAWQQNIAIRPLLCYTVSCLFVNIERVIQ